MKSMENSRPPAILLASARTQLLEPACSHGPEMGHLTKTFHNGQVVALVWGALILVLRISATEAL